MAEKTAHVLRNALEVEIVEGRLTPGTHLDETSLAERFSVSRTPIREALLGLESSGLVELRPRRGAFVRRVGLTELVEMFEVMAEIEVTCGRFACRRMTRPQEVALLDCLRTCEAAAMTGDVAEYYAQNELFHAAIYAAAGNRFLESQALALQGRLKPFRRHQLYARGRLAQSRDEHRDIVAAIQAGNETRTAEALRAHITVQGEKFLALAATLDQTG
ncbi:MAG: GntR family transcriptional regulator [Pseudomonadota bacterium]